MSLCSKEPMSPTSRRYYIGGSDARIMWMVATLDGRVQGSEAVFEAKFM